MCQASRVSLFLLEGRESEGGEEGAKGVGRERGKNRNCKTRNSIEGVTRF